MKVLFFTKYTRKGASSRLRTYQYLDFLRKNGLQCDVEPFFDDQYLDEVYKSKRHNKFLALKSFLRRIWRIFAIWKYDKVVIEKELIPYFPAFFEWILSVAGVKYIVDYDDAIFHNYDVSSNSIVRWLLKDKIRKVVRHADCVVAGNDYLRNTFLSYGAKRVELIPTVIDIHNYRVKQNYQSERFTIGWIGSPITFKYIARLKPVFMSLSAKYPIKIIYIGANTSLGLSNEEVLPWDEKNESDFIRRFDVGIMPLEDNIWERGKCGYKLIQYMGCAVPVIGTPIGVNNQLICEGVNGFQAVSETDWELALEKLISNSPHVNQEMGQAGRNIVERHYSLQVYRNAWLRILKVK